MMEHLAQPFTIYQNNCLTKRELEIAKLIINERNNHEIANSLFVSPYTVDTHRKNIFRKLNISSSLGLLRWAIRNKVEVEI
jgi:DNA-binding CsgD family transcriptional regulator